MASSSEPAASVEPPVADFPPSKTSIALLRENNKLWYKIHVFIYDLRAFRSSTPSRSRLETVTAADYLGLPYFTSSEADALRNTIINPTTGQTLGEELQEFFETKLEKRLKGRMKETGDYRVCAAHDLAPVFEKAFRVNCKDLSKNKAFMRLVGKGGLEALDDGSVWGGVGKR